MNDNYQNMQRVYTIGIVVSSCVVRVDEIIGHVPRELFIEVRHFLRHRGQSTCEVIGRRRCGNGLELPCRLSLCCKAVADQEAGRFASKPSHHIVILINFSQSPYNYKRLYR